MISNIITDTGSNLGVMKITVIDVMEMGPGFRM